MLPAQARVRTRDEHARINRAGRRVRRGPVVVHSLSTGGDAPARAGVVVGRKVGTAVVRNRVRRRLREQVRTRLAGVAPGTLIVVRALPEAAAASSAELGAALESALRPPGGGGSRGGGRR
jgi:ribonuclease P protein component